MVPELIIYPKAKGLKKSTNNHIQKHNKSCGQFGMPKNVLEEESAETCEVRGKGIVLHRSPTHPEVPTSSWILGHGVEGPKS